MAESRKYAPDTLAVHADDVMNSYTDVAPALHVSTTFRYDNSKLVPISDEEVLPLLTFVAEKHLTFE